MKRFSLGCLFLLLLLSIAGCTPQPQQSAPSATEAPLLLGFSQLGSESSWRLACTNSIQNAALEQGIHLMFLNANQSQEKQIAAIRSFIAYQVDVIAFCPIVEKGWDHVLNEAKTAGIPVLLVDRMLQTDDPSLYTAYVGADFLLEGQQAASYLIRKADEMKAEHLNIVEITGTVDSTPMRQRYTGFHDKLAGDSRFTFLESISGGFVLSKGKECMKHLLERYGDRIDVLYSHNDSMTLGAVSAIEEAGMVPGKDIIIISIDAEQAVIDLLKQGKVNCVMECSPHLGNIVMQLAQMIKAGQPIPSVCHPAEQMFTEYDDLSKIGSRGY